MYVATNRLRVEKGQGQELERRFAHAGSSDGRPGFIDFELWKLVGDEDYDEFLVVTHWKSEEAHTTWVASEDFKRVHSGPQLEHAVGPGEFRGYDVRLGADVETAHD